MGLRDEDGEADEDDDDDDDDVVFDDELLWLKCLSWILVKRG
jgi:hypothetical protein